MQAFAIPAVTTMTIAAISIRCGHESHFRYVTEACRFLVPVLVLRSCRWRSSQNTLLLWKLLNIAPHYAVCSEVLNLPSQVGSLPGSSALAQAYRVTSARLSPYQVSVGSKPGCGITCTAGYLSYTTKKAG